MRKLLGAILILFSVSAYAQNNVLTRDGKASLCFWDDSNISLNVDGGGTGSATYPSFSLGDGDTGFFESADDTVILSLGGVGWYNFNNSSIYSSTTGGFQISRLNSSATVPSYTFNNDDATGIGTAAISQLSLIAGGVEGVRVTNEAITMNSLLDNATGEERAVSINYTVNKSTSGNDTGLLINMTDIASPGTSYLIDAKVGGASKLNLGTGGILNIANGFIMNSGYVQTTSSQLALYGYYGSAAVASTNVNVLNVTKTNTSGQNNQFAISPTYNQTSGTASNTDFLINRTETAVGSGAQLFMDAQVGSDSKFSIANDGTVSNEGKLIHEPSSDTAIVAGTGLTVTRTIQRVVGSGGAVTVTATPNIADGTDGQIVYIQGTDDTNTVEFQDADNLASSGLALAGSVNFTMGEGDTLVLTYDAGEDLWYEISRSDN